MSRPRGSTKSSVRARLVGLLAPSRRRSGCISRRRCRPVSSTRCLARGPSARRMPPTPSPWRGDAHEIEAASRGPGQLVRLPPFRTGKSSRPGLRQPAATPIFALHRQHTRRGEGTGRHAVPARRAAPERTAASSSRRSRHHRLQRPLAWSAAPRGAASARKLWEALVAELPTVDVIRLTKDAG